MPDRDEIRVKGTALCMTSDRPGVYLDDDLLIPPEFIPDGLEWEMRRGEPLLVRLRYNPREPGEVYRVALRLVDELGWAVQVEVAS